MGKVKLLTASRKTVEDKNYKGAVECEMALIVFPFFTGSLVWTVSDALGREEVETSRVGGIADKGGWERSLRVKAWPYFQPYYLFLYLSKCEELLTHASATTPQTLPCLFYMLDGNPEPK